MVEAFALSFDGSKAVIGKEEFHKDETLITEVTETKICRVEVLPKA